MSSVLSQQAFGLLVKQENLTGTAAHRIHSPKPLKSKTPGALESSSLTRKLEPGAQIRAPEGSLSLA